MDAHSRIELFGDLRVVQGTQVHTRFRTRKAGLLLAYLALHAPQPQPRERLVDLFWGDKAEDVGRDGLSTALAQLRRQLETSGVPAGSLFLADKQQVRLHPLAVTSDVADFDRLLEEARRSEDKTEKARRLHQAVTLYRGDVLPGCYEEWAGGEQTRCRLLYQESLLRLIPLWEEAGRYVEALAMAQRVCAADPFAEEGYRAQMRLLVRLKKPSAALRLYEDMETLFQRELGGRPSASTRQMAEMIRQDPRAILLMRAEAAADARLCAPSAEGAEGEKISAPSPAVALPDPPALPLQLTRFFGREKERAQVAQLLQTPDTRLVSLLGPGGAGKTRLSLEVAAQVVPAFANRVWFISLADIPDASLIVSTLVHALRLPPDAQADPFERVVASLGSAPCLLVLDNLEHLLRDTPRAGKGDTQGMSGGAGLIRLLLQRVPGLVCLVTSRQALRLGGEHVYPLPPLALPSQEAAESLETLRNIDSVALYVDRARAARPDFALSAQNAPAVAALCRRLEGMPLALEMAAAWVRTIPPAKMLERLSQQLEMLVSRQRDLPPRHQSLRATIEWSYDLLSPELRQAFARLGVFRGGWTLEAAEAVCGGHALHALRELQEYSLIVEEEEKEDSRYRMLEPLREFALENLEDGRNVRERHVAFFLAFAEQAFPHLSGPEAGHWAEVLEKEHDNLRQALTYCLEDGAETVKGLRMGAALSPFWVMRGYLSEGRQRLTALLAHPGGQESTAVRARALHGEGIVARSQGDYAQARALHEESLTTRRALGDKSGIANSLNQLGIVAHMQGDYAQAQILYEESLEIAREMGDKAGISNGVNNLGNIAYMQGNYARAQVLYEESLAIARDLGDEGGIAASLNNLGIAAYEKGDYAQARVLYEESLAIRRALGDKGGIASSLSNMGNVAFRQGDYAQAQGVHEESLALVRALGDKGNIAGSLNYLGNIACMQGNYARAQVLYEESLALVRALGDKLGVAIDLEAFASLAIQEAQEERSARLWGAAAALRTTIACPLPPHAREKQGHEAASARKTLGTEAYEAAWAQGRDMTMEQAIRYALKEVGG